MNLSEALLTVMLEIIVQSAGAQTPEKPTKANLCEVVASADAYNGKLLTVEGILYPGDHSLALYSPSCKPTEQRDVSMQAVLPKVWESLPNGKHLLKLLRKGKPARVTVTGTFESGVDRYGPDVARFRFVIGEMPCVESAPLG